MGDNKEANQIEIKLYGGTATKATIHRTKGTIYAPSIGTNFAFRNTPPTPTLPNARSNPQIQFYKQNTQLRAIMCS